MTVDFKSQAEFDVIRETERERLRALVEGNMEVARKLHADDFQLISPLGGTFPRSSILAAWRPEKSTISCGNLIRLRSARRGRLRSFDISLSSKSSFRGEKCRANATGTRTHTKSEKGGGRLSGPKPRQYSSRPIRSLL